MRPISDAERAKINARYDDIMTEQFLSRHGHGYEEPPTLTMSATPEERQRVFERLWHKGNGFRFLYGGFKDVASNPEANEEACKFLRAKIRSIVKDPVKAAYEKFNQENVFAVDLKKTPITAVEKKSIRTADGQLHELDIIVLATGFQSGDGSYKAVQGGITGCNEVLFSDHWEDKMKTYLGIFVSSFPNLFMVTGPQGSFGDAPRTIESEVVFLTTMIADLREAGRGRVIECTAEAEVGWGLLCDQLAASETLVNKVSSWMTGKHTAGTNASTMFHYGGLNAYRSILRDVKNAHYRGLLIT
ncbi:Baeyer-Villiger monooxygenase [Lachnellula subtilissima]|uniref:Baeyer-Villiger monooxygenase n=1 Tax=Lachnellula subtilissima TaxID=602034 RepID=A0A8H8UHY4_9HELO|nr:Baeyer-Villiger monooxygenase [Lachnellula subtilissima]